jgi:hypothetical protein
MAPALIGGRAASLVGVRGPYTHSPLTRRPSGNTVSTWSTRVPASEGPNAPMTLAMSWRDSHIPHARSGGISPLIGRNVYVLTAAAPRDRNEPRAGTPSVMQRSQSQMVTLVNGSFRGGYPGTRIAGVAPAADVPDVRGGVTLLDLLLWSPTAGK